MKTLTAAIWIASILSLLGQATQTSTRLGNEPSVVINESGLTNLKADVSDEDPDLNHSNWWLSVDEIIPKDLDADIADSPENGDWTIPGNWATVKVPGKVESNAAIP
ncbi:MAG TPA: hypothetical protein EYQ50_01405 [Verrucomicrobiales bacterium]|nr:hypothetical protein [Verrucomicrobiales bacterium]